MYLEEGDWNDRIWEKEPVKMETPKEEEYVLILNCTVYTHINVCHP
jgi:hypothetical protein